MIISITRDQASRGEKWKHDNILKSGSLPIYTQQPHSHTKAFLSWNMKATQGRKGWMEITWWWINYFLLLYFHIHMVSLSNSAMIYVKWLWMEIGERKKSEAGQVNLQHMRPFFSLLNSLFFVLWNLKGIFSALFWQHRHTAIYICVKSSDLNFCVHWPFGLEKACLFTWNILK